MKVRIWPSLMATAAVLVVGSVAEAPKANAQGLFSAIFGGGFNRERQYEREYDRRLQPRYNERRRDDAYRRRQSRDFWGNTQRREAPPQVTVSSPRYFTYEPDRPVKVSFAELSETQVADLGPHLAPVADMAFESARAELRSLSLRVLPEVGEALKTHYGDNPKFLWIEKRQVTPRARAMLDALADAGRFGLSPSDYSVDVPTTATFGGRLSTRELVQFEFELSAKLLTYALDATRGRIDPNKISGYHDFKRKAVDLETALTAASGTGAAADWIVEQNPNAAPFAKLVAELDRLESAKPVKRVTVAPGTMIRPGETNPELRNVVAAVEIAISKGLLTKHLDTFIDYQGGAVYTPELEALVRDFQKEAGLSVDGVVGPNTVSRMVPESNAEKVSKVKLAMERLRWLPRDLGQRHVLINQPSFTASYVENDVPKLTMNVVIGQKSNQTYFFSDEIETVEYNPYWGVPRSIIVNEMIPKLYQDPSYLDRAGYEVTNTSGRRIASSSVDWYAVATKQASVDVRQPPGGGNALGRLKILFPNSHAIYMHDTPQKQLFGRTVRAFSHGCVRLEHPREMAAAVLGQNVGYINSRIAEGRNDDDKIGRDVSVHVAYFTAWPSESGIAYYDDIYDRDAKLTEALTATESVRTAES